MTSTCSILILLDGRRARQLIKEDKKLLHVLLIFSYKMIFLSGSWHLVSLSLSLSFDCRSIVAYDILQF